MPTESPVFRSQSWTAFPPVFAVGISIPNQQQPGAAGTMVSLPASTQQPLTPRFQGGLGGGPLSHVPWGHNPGVLFCGGPAYWMFGTNGGSNGPGPTGWYVVTPGILPTLTAIHAVDTALNSQYFYSYPVGAVPNGTPLAHPADISKSGISTHIKGIAWVPYSFPGIVVYSLDLLVAAPAGPTTQSTAQHTIGSPLGGNFPGLPQLPKQRPVPPHPNWQGTIILQDQKTNFKAEYGLGLWGY